MKILLAGAGLALAFAFSLLGDWRDDARLTIEEVRYRSKADGAVWIWRVYRDRDGNTIGREIVRAPEE
jgi:hypothetical protein